MRVLQVPYCFMPDPIGGTEVYVSALARELEADGVLSIIAAPGAITQDYSVDNLRVRRFAVGGALDLPELYGLGDAIAARGFAEVLDQHTPDLVHLHALSPAISVQLVRVTKAREIPIVFTYHTPTVTCQRGTMMRWGQDICDGALCVARCSACTLQGAGVNRLVANRIGSLPPAIGRWLRNYRLRGGILTAIRMTDLIQIRHESFREIASNVDHFVAVCEWVRDVLLINEIPPEKISLSRQGVEVSQELNQLEPFAPSEGGLKIAFVGRLDPTKGLHILIEAIRLHPELDVTLDVFGVTQTQTNEAYRRRVVSLADNDNRINFCMPLVSRDLRSRIRQYDFVAVPSQWLETGPMVVLEAFAAGTPVIGSKFGGLREIVRDGIDGLLIERNDPGGWADALRRLSQSREMKSRIRLGVRPPRTSRNVADDMLNIYKRVLAVRRDGERSDLVASL